jgi:regulator of cell morphogenesis and NO signaling
MNTEQLNKLKNAGDETCFIADISNETAIDFNYNENKISKEFHAAEPDKCEADYLIDNIVGKHNAFAKNNAIIMYDLIQKVAYSCSALHPQLKRISKVSFFLFQSLLNQLMKEEQYLFPYIKQTIKDITHGGNNSGSPLHILKEKIHQHQNKNKKSLRYLKIFRRLTDNYSLPHNSCNAYKVLCEKMEEFEGDLHIYFHLENNILLKCMHLANGSESKG